MKTCTNYTNCNENLEMWLQSKMIVNFDDRFSYIGNFTLGELKDLRELVQHAIVERLCEYSPVVFEPIFSDEIKEK